MTAELKEKIMLRAMRITLFTTVVVMLILPVSGCGREKPRTGDDRIVAEINNYKMTVGDFKGEARFAAVSGVAAKDPALAKSEILDEIIMKKLLIQEAQAQNFDKDKAFMKEIERYWEQALLKLLYKKKSEELARAISVSDGENGKLQQAIEAWMNDLRSRARIKIYEDNLKGIDIK